MDAVYVYEVSIERHRRPWMRPLRVVGTLISAVLFDGVAPPAVGDCVVRRIVGDREVLRFCDDGDTYEHIRHQLATMSAAEFEEAWGIGAGTVEG